MEQWQSPHVYTILGLQRGRNAHNRHKHHTMNTHTQFNHQAITRNMQNFTWFSNRVSIQSTEEEYSPQLLQESSNEIDETGLERINSI